MHRRLAVLCLCILAACSPSGDAAPDAVPQEDAIELTLTRHEDGSWTALYRFPQAAPAWVFPRSALTRADGEPWRPASWTVRTPGVRLDRVGDRDVLVAEDGNVPIELEVGFTPYTSLLLADYVPVLAFSDGAQAVFTGHFIAGPADREALATGTDPFEDAPALQVEFVDAAGGPIAVGGTVGEGRVAYAGEDDTYAYFGSRAPEVTEHLVLLIDGQVPGWISAELNAFMPALMALYAERFRVELRNRPSVYAVWEGAEVDGFSMGGSVAPGLLAANFSGAQMLEPNAAILGHLRTFYAHEAAHFWNGWTAVPESRTNAFVHEGGADALSFLAMDALVADFDLEAARAAAVARCRQGGGPAPLAEAQREGRDDAVYGCGALAHFAAAQALAAQGHDLFDLWEAVIAGALERDRPTYALEDWLAALEALSGDGELVATLRTWSETGLGEAQFEALAARAAAQ